MWFYLILLFFFLLVGIVELFFKPKKHTFLLLIIKIIPFVILFLLNVLKKETVGYDTIHYKEWYEALLNGLNPGGSYPNAEIGFKFVTKMFANMHLPYIIYIIFMNLLIYVPLAIALLRTSKNIGFSMFIYSCLSILVINISALRQSIAINMCLLALSFLKTKKIPQILLALLFIVIGGLFHSSGFVFVIAIPLIFIKMKSSYLIYIIPFMLLFFFISPKLFEAFYYLVRLSTYMPIYREGVGGYYFLFLFIFAFFALISENSIVTNKMYSVFIKIENKFIKNKKEIQADIITEDSYNKSIILIFLMSALFQSTSRINYALPRLALPFFAIASIFVPNTILNIKDKAASKTVLVFVALGFVAFFMYDTLLPNYLGLIPYQFFWQ